MRKFILFSLPVLLLVLAASGCVQSQNGQPSLVCNPPYMMSGQDCCLDQNGNNICDSSESQQQPRAYCGDGTCGQDENCTTCASDCGECAPAIIEDSGMEFRAIVYEAVKRYVDEAPEADFEHIPRTDEEAAFDEWQYPTLESGINTSEQVMSVSIKSYSFGLGGPESIYDRISSGTAPEGAYIKNTQNGKIMVLDTTTEFTKIPPSGRYDYIVEFTCGMDYDVRISTWDFYGSGISDLYVDYDIDRMAIENAATEVLGTCV